MSKYAIIMRGVPGSGKSTVTGFIERAVNNSRGICVVHSTDNLCMENGEYKFDAEKAGERHAQNLQNFKDSLAAGVDCVICDNTNIKTNQYQPYMKASEDAGYRVVIVELPHPSPCLASYRNKHGVPQSVINQMIMDWEPSQHCVTVAKVAHAYEIVERLQARAKASILIGFFAGSIVGALLFYIAGHILG